MTEDNCPQCGVYRQALLSLLREIDQQVREGLDWPNPNCAWGVLSGTRTTLGMNPNGTTEPNDR